MFLRLKFINRTAQYWFILIYSNWIRDSSDDQLIARKEPLPISTYIEKKEELILEEKPKEEVEVEIIEEKEMPETRILEEIILEERVPEEKILEERMLERKISEERKEERIERIVVEKKDEAVQTDDDIGESSSDSIYSYSTYISSICVSHHISINACRQIRTISQINKSNYWYMCQLIKKDHERSKSNIVECRLKISKHKK